MLKSNKLRAFIATNGRLINRDGTGRSPMPQRGQHRARSLIIQRLGTCAEQAGQTAIRRSTNEIVPQASHAPARRPLTAVRGGSGERACGSRPAGGRACAGRGSGAALPFDGAQGQRRCALGLRGGAHLRGAPHLLGGHTPSSRWQSEAPPRIGFASAALRRRARGAGAVPPLTSSGGGMWRPRMSRPPCAAPTPIDRSRELQAQLAGGGADLRPATADVGGTPVPFRAAPCYSPAV